MGRSGETDGGEAAQVDSQLRERDSRKKQGNHPMHMRQAKFRIGEVVRHRIYPFRGVIFDVDPEFSNTEEWWLSIPENVRPNKNQPFYHLLAENAETTYIAYVSEQNLVLDKTGEPVSHPQLEDMFVELENGCYVTRNPSTH